MVYDKKIAELFILNFNEAYRSGKLLLESHKRIGKLIPLEEGFLKKLEIDDLDKLDAFRVRFCDLQDSLGNKTFRSILNLEEEETGSNLDTLNKMVKRGIINSFDDWKKLRNIRNLFSHDYPDSDKEKAEALNIAYSFSLKLIGTLDNVIKYMEQTLNLPLKEFPPLIKK